LEEGKKELRRKVGIQDEEKREERKTK